MFLLGADVYKTPESAEVQEDLIDDETPKSVDWRTEVKFIFISLIFTQFFFYYRINFSYFDIQCFLKLFRVTSRTLRIKAIAVHAGHSVQRDQWKEHGLKSKIS